MLFLLTFVAKFRNRIANQSLRYLSWQNWRGEIDLKPWLMMMRCCLLEGGLNNDAAKIEAAAKAILEELSKKV